MQALYTTTTSLDKRAIAKFLLNEELLMENAAAALEQLISTITHDNSVINIICGSGDNGGDGYALARRLEGHYRIKIYEAKPPKSALCLIQHERAKAAGCEWVKKLLPCDVLVDCLFGSGFTGELSAEFIALLTQMNELSCVRIACDMPSGLDIHGRIASYVFKAHYTLSLGALKVALFSDMAKDCVGKVLVGNLGISSKQFAVQSSYHLLEESDLILPHRMKQNCHKGSFGHVSVITGDHIGASMLCALSAQKMGAGGASLITKHSLMEHINSISAHDVSHGTTSSTQPTQSTTPSTSTTLAQALAPLASSIADAPSHPILASSYIEIVRLANIPNKANVLCLGMGLGECGAIITHCATSGKLCVIDADAFYTKELCDVLDAPTAQNLILTPHPKEFHALLQHCGIDASTYADVAHNRFALALEFSKTYPHITLLLKGANPIIAQNGKLYINPLGTNALAKSGSGDVLAGIIAALLAQGYAPLDAAICASLAHALAAKKEKNAYALTPLRLIEHLGNL